jgi:hypothetical protein
VWGKTVKYWYGFWKAMTLFNREVPGLSNSCPSLVYVFTMPTSGYKKVATVVLQPPWTFSGKVGRNRIEICRCEHWSWAGTPSVWAVKLEQHCHLVMGADTTLIKISATPSPTHFSSSFIMPLDAFPGEPIHKQCPHVGAFWAFWMGARSHVRSANSDQRSDPPLNQSCLSKGSFTLVK